MATQALACARCAAAVGLLAGCSSPFEPASDIAGSQRDALPEGVADVPRSVYRKDARPGDSRDPSLPAGASPDEYIRYALYHSPEVEAAYQRWRASAERLPQVRALPDPRLRFGFFLDEVETRTGAQQARVGVSQRFPWPGTLGGREALARRLAVSREREGEANRIAASIHRAWFEHTDAHRRVRLFERTLIPKAEQSLRASLAGFRAGETSFLDLLDTERTLLEFALSAERAKADRGQALARLQRLVGEPVPTEPAKQPRQPDTTGEAQP